MATLLGMHCCNIPSALYVKGACGCPCVNKARVCAGTSTGAQSEIFDQRSQPKLAKKIPAHLVRPFELGLEIDLKRASGSGAPGALGTGPWRAPWACRRRRLQFSHKSTHTTPDRNYMVAACTHGVRHEGSAGADKGAVIAGNWRQPLFLSEKHHMRTSVHSACYNHTSREKYVVAGNTQPDQFEEWQRQRRWRMTLAGMRHVQAIRTTHAMSMQH